MSNPTGISAAIRQGQAASQIITSFLKEKQLTGEGLTQDEMKVRLKDMLDIAIAKVAPFDREWHGKGKKKQTWEDHRIDTVIQRDATPDTPESDIKVVQVPTPTPEWIAAWDAVVSDVNASLTVYIMNADRAKEESDKLPDDLVAAE